MGATDGARGAPPDVAALLVDADATVADMTNVCEGEYSPWMTSYGTELYPDEVARNITALATALRAALADQRRYQWLRTSAMVTVYNAITLDGGATVITPGRIGGTVVDEVCDAALAAADGGGV